MFLTSTLAPPAREMFASHLIAPSSSPFETPRDSMMERSFSRNILASRASSMSGSVTISTSAMPALL